MKYQNHAFWRITSLLTVMVFTWTTILGDTPLLAQTINLGAVSAELKGIASDPVSVPAELGTLRDSYVPAGKSDQPFILHIQDAHANPDAQQKIRQLLSWIHEHQDFSVQNKRNAAMVVALEGAVGSLYPEYLEFFPEYPAANEAVIQDLVTKGELSGAELFAWDRYKARSKGEESFKNLQLLGVETPELYRENLLTYRTLIFQGEQLELYLKEIRKNLEIAQTRVLSGDLQDFIRERERRKHGNYENSAMNGNSMSSPQLVAYLTYLSAQASDRLGIDLNDRFEQVRYPNLVRILQIGAVEKEIHRGKARKQKRLLEQKLTKVAKSDEEKSLLDALKHFENHTRPRAVTEALWKACEHFGWETGAFSQFWKWSGEIILRQEIEAGALFDEIAQIEKSLIDQMITSNDERRLIEILDDATLFEKLLHLKLTPEDHDRLLENPRAVFSRVLNDELAVLMSKAGAKGKDFTLSNASRIFLGDAGKRAMDFYTSARQRDEAILENTLKSAGNARLAVLITGGFHTPGLTHLMKSSEIGYAVVQPRINETDGGVLYEKVMMDKHADLSAYFERSDLSKQEALFLKSLMEIAAPALWEEYQVPHTQIGVKVAEVIKTNPILKQRLQAEAEKLQRGSAVEVEVEPLQGSYARQAPDFMAATVADALKMIDRDIYLGLRADVLGAAGGVTEGVGQVGGREINRMRAVWEPVRGTRTTIETLVPEVAGQDAALNELRIIDEFLQVEDADLLDNLPALNTAWRNSDGIVKNELETLRRDRYAPALRNDLIELSRNLMSELPGQWELMQAVARAAGDENLIHQYDYLPIPLLRHIDNNSYGEGATNLWDRVAADENVVRLLQRERDAYRAYMANEDSWVSENDPDLAKKNIAYFSAEYGLKTLKIYSGGLGILSGDHLRGASDLGLSNFTGVGLLYQLGYFKQRITSDGRQETDDTYKGINREDLPLESVKVPGTNDDLYIRIPLPGRHVTAKVWRVKYGKANLLLLDTNLDGQENEGDRYLTDRVYRADGGSIPRMEQYTVLGVGGMMALQALGIKPDVQHLNDGHPFFSALEAIRQEMMELEQEIPDPNERFETALEIVGARTVFTTHTPIAAGNETVDSTWVLRQFVARIFDGNEYMTNRIMSMGAQFNGENFNDGTFEISAFSLRLASYRNGVSDLHGHVAQRMWQPGVFPGTPVDDVPVPGIVNSVHQPYWQSQEFQDLFADAMQDPEVQDLMHNWDLEEFAAKMSDAAWVNEHVQVDDDALENARLKRKQLLIDEIRRRNSLRASGDVTPTVNRVISELDPNALTLGFARRFIEYKRALLIFHDLDRLKEVARKSEKPIQLVFAGKAHPDDGPSKEIIRRLHEYANQLNADKSNNLRIVFVPEYNVELARVLEAGVDGWINTPIRPREASGTSGEKASMNGVFNISTRDGWSVEGIVDGVNGFLFGVDGYDRDDDTDAAQLYDKLEEVVALYDTPGRKKFLRMIKAAVIGSVYQFGMERMLATYARKMYRPAADNRTALSVEEARARARDRRRQRNLFLEKFSTNDSPVVDTSTIRPFVAAGATSTFSVVADLKGLNPAEVGVDLMIRKPGEGWTYVGMGDYVEDQGSNRYRYEANAVLPDLADYEVRVRISPRDQLAWESSREQNHVTRTFNAPSNVRAVDAELLEYRAASEIEQGMAFQVGIPTDEEITRVSWASGVTGWTDNAIEMTRLGNRAVVVVPAEQTGRGYHEFKMFAERASGEVALGLTGNYPTSQNMSNAWVNIPEEDLPAEQADPFFDRNAARRVLDNLNPRAELRADLAEEVDQLTALRSEYGLTEGGTPAAVNLNQPIDLRADFPALYEFLQGEYEVSHRRNPFALDWARAWEDTVPTTLTRVAQSGQDFHIHGTNARGQKRLLIVRVDRGAHAPNPINDHFYVNGFEARSLFNQIVPEYVTLTSQNNLHVRIKGFRVSDSADPARVPAADAQVDVIEDIQDEQGILSFSRTAARKFITDGLVAANPSAWNTVDDETARDIVQWLGWVKAPENYAREVAQLETLTGQVRSEGYNRVLLLGAGGSFWGAQALQSMAGIDPGFAELIPVDLTDPEVVHRTAELVKGHEAETLIVVASKSGTTADTMTLYRHFAEMVDSPEQQIVGISDPGKAIDGMEEPPFRQVFRNDPAIGGRFSAISYFGLLPASLVGVDVARVVDSALARQRLYEEDPGLAEQVLNLVMHLVNSVKEGNNKWTIRLSEDLKLLGPWLQQIINESLGKRAGMPVLIVDESESDEVKASYGDDRLIIDFRSTTAGEFEVQRTQENGKPQLIVSVPDIQRNVGALLYDLEIATAVTGYFLGLHPFDQPAVEESKKLTREILSGSVDLEAPQIRDAGVEVFYNDLSGVADAATAQEAVRQFIAGTQEGDYFALFPYTYETPEMDQVVRDIRTHVNLTTGVATIGNVAPRYQHSDGQSIIANPGSVIILSFEPGEGRDLPIPRFEASFGELTKAMALGNFGAFSLPARAMHVHLPSEYRENPEKILALFGITREELRANYEPFYDAETVGAVVDLDRLNADQRRIINVLFEADQGYLFNDWDPQSFFETEKRAMLDIAIEMDRSLGGLESYHEGMVTLFDRARNNVSDFANYEPELAPGIQVPDFDAWDELSAEGLKYFNRTGVVIVAGGLGKRLGYEGIKLAIPFELALMRKYLEHYVKSILALQAESNAINGEDRDVPIFIMTSPGDNDSLTRQLLIDNNYFGAKPEQIQLQQQGIAPAVADVGAHFLKKSKYELQVEPPGHGDVHRLLAPEDELAGVIEQWQEQGFNHTFFIQDTNSQSMNALAASLAVSVRENADANAITVPREAGEATGAIMRLKDKDTGATKVVNVEYSDLGAFLEAVLGHGDIADPATPGLSPYPANLNAFVFKNEALGKILRATGGQVRRFVNIKEWYDDERTKFKATRVESMYQDILHDLQDRAQEVLGRDAIVVYTNFADKSLVFIPTKNDHAGAAGKIAAGQRADHPATSEHYVMSENAAMWQWVGANVEFPQGAEAEGYAELEVSREDFDKLKPEIKALAHSVSAEGAVYRLPYATGPRIVNPYGSPQQMKAAFKDPASVSIEKDATVALDGNWNNYSIGDHVYVRGSLVIKIDPSVPFDQVKINLQDLVVESGKLTETPLTAEEKTDQFLAMRGYALKPADPANPPLVINITEAGDYVITGNSASAEGVQVNHTPREELRAGVEALEFNLDDLAQQIFAQLRTNRSDYVAIWNAAHPQDGGDADVSVHKELTEEILETLKLVEHPENLDAALTHVTNELVNLIIADEEDPSLNVSTTTSYAHKDEVQERQEAIQAELDDNLPGVHADMVQDAKFRTLGQQTEDEIAQLEAAVASWKEAGDRHIVLVGSEVNDSVVWLLQRLSAHTDWNSYARQNGLPQIHILHSAEPLAISNLVKKIGAEDANHVRVVHVGEAGYSSEVIISELTANIPGTVQIANTQDRNVFNENTVGLIAAGLLDTANIRAIYAGARAEYAGTDEQAGWSNLEGDEAVQRHAALKLAAAQVRMARSGQNAAVFDMFSTVNKTLSRFFAAMYNRKVDDSDVSVFFAGEDQTNFSHSTGQPKSQAKAFPWNPQWEAKETNGGFISVTFINPRTNRREVLVEGEVDHMFEGHGLRFLLSSAREAIRMANEISGRPVLDVNYDDNTLGDLGKLIEFVQVSAEAAGRLAGRSGAGVTEVDQLQQRLVDEQQLVSAADVLPDGRIEREQNIVSVENGQLGGVIGDAVRRGDLTLEEVAAVAGRFVATSGLQSVVKKIDSVDRMVHLDEEEIRKDLELGETEEMAGHLRKYKKVYVVAIGGSTTGETLVNMLGMTDGPQIVGVTSYDADQMIAIQEDLKAHPDEVGVVVISKSGTTAETQINGELIENELLRHLEPLHRERPDIIAEHFVFVTDPQTGSLARKVKERGYRSLPHHIHIGGRFSMFSNVGLLVYFLKGGKKEALLPTLDQWAEENEAVRALSNQLRPLRKDLLAKLDPKADVSQADRIEAIATVLGFLAPDPATGADLLGGVRMGFLDHLLTTINADFARNTEIALGWSGYYQPFIGGPLYPQVTTESLGKPSSAMYVMTVAGQSYVVDQWNRVISAAGQTAHVKVFSNTPAAGEEASDAAIAEQAFHNGVVGRLQENDIPYQTVRGQATPANTLLMMRALYLALEVNASMFKPVEVASEGQPGVQLYKDILRATLALVSKSLQAKEARIRKGTEVEEGVEARIPRSNFRQEANWQAAVDAEVADELSDTRQTMLSPVVPPHLTERQTDVKAEFQWLGDHEGLVHHLVFGAEGQAGLVTGDSQNLVKKSHIQDVVGGVQERIAGLLTGSGQVARYYLDTNDGQGNRLSHEQTVLSDDGYVVSATSIEDVKSLYAATANGTTLEIYPGATQDEHLDDSEMISIQIMWGSSVRVVISYKDKAQDYRLEPDGSLIEVDKAGREVNNAEMSVYGEILSVGAPTNHQPPAFKRYFDEILTPYLDSKIRHQENVPSANLVQILDKQGVAAAYLTWRQAFGFANTIRAAGGLAVIMTPNGLKHISDIDITDERLASDEQVYVYAGNPENIHGIQAYLDFLSAEDAQGVPVIGRLVTQFAKIPDFPETQTVRAQAVMWLLRLQESLEALPVSALTGDVKTRVDTLLNDIRTALSPGEGHLDAERAIGALRDKYLAASPADRVRDARQYALLGDRRALIRTRGKAGPDMQFFYNHIEPLYESAQHMALLTAIHSGLDGVADSEAHKTRLEVDRVKEALHRDYRRNAIGRVEKSDQPAEPQFTTEVAKVIEVETPKIEKVWYDTPISDYFSNNLLVSPMHREIGFPAQEDGRHVEGVQRVLDVFQQTYLHDQEIEIPSIEALGEAAGWDEHQLELINELLETEPEIFEQRDGKLFVKSLATIQQTIRDRKLGSAMNLSGDLSSRLDEIFNALMIFQMRPLVSFIISEEESITVKGLREDEDGELVEVEIERTRYRHVVTLPGGFKLTLLLDPIDGSSQIGAAGAYGVIVSLGFLKPDQEPADFKGGENFLFGFDLQFGARTAVTVTNLAAPTDQPGVSKPEVAYFELLAQGAKLNRDTGETAPESAFYRGRGGLDFGDFREVEDQQEFDGLVAEMNEDFPLAFALGGSKVQFDQLGAHNVFVEWLRQFPLFTAYTGALLADIKVIARHLYGLHNYGGTTKHTDGRFRLGFEEFYYAWMYFILGGEAVDGYNPILDRDLHHNKYTPSEITVPWYAGSRWITKLIMAFNRHFDNFLETRDQTTELTVAEVKAEWESFLTYYKDRGRSRIQAVVNYAAANPALPDLTEKQVRRAILDLHGDISDILVLVDDGQATFEALRERGAFADLADQTPQQELRTAPDVTEQAPREELRIPPAVAVEKAPATNRFDDIFRQNTATADARTVVRGVIERDFPEIAGITDLNELFAGRTEINAVAQNATSGVYSERLGTTLELSAEEVIALVLRTTFALDAFGNERVDAILATFNNNLGASADKFSRTGEFPVHWLQQRTVDELDEQALVLLAVMSMINPGDRVSIFIPDDPEEPLDLTVVQARYGDLVRRMGIPSEYRDKLNFKVMPDGSLSAMAKEMRRLVARDKTRKAAVLDEEIEYLERLGYSRESSRVHAKTLTGRVALLLTAQYLRNQVGEVRPGIIDLESEISQFVSDMEELISNVTNAAAAVARVWASA